MTSDNKLNPSLHFLAGGLGGTVGAVLTCPLEVIKTRQQSSQYLHQHRLGLITMLQYDYYYLIKRTIYHKEGIRGLWRGIGPNLVGVIPSRAIYFSTYASTKKYLKDIQGQESTLTHLLSAVSAGVCTATFSNPIWLVKTRMQLQHNRPKSQAAANNTSTSTKSTTTSCCTSNTELKIKQQMRMIQTEAVYYKNGLDCLVKIIRYEGPLALFRGLSASYLGIIEGTLQWVCYEYLKKQTEQSQSPLSYTLLTAGTAKFFAALITYPHEVLRTRLRQSIQVMEQGQLVMKPKYRGILDVVRSIWYKEGVLSFYGGLTAHLLRTVPNAAIMFFCYEAFVFTFDRPAAADNNK